MSLRANMFTKIQSQLSICSGVHLHRLLKQDRRNTVGAEPRSLAQQNGTVWTCCKLAHKLRKTFNAKPAACRRRICPRNLRTHSYFLLLPPLTYPHHGLECQSPLLLQEMPTDGCHEVSHAIQSAELIQLCVRVGLVSLSSILLQYVIQVGITIKSSNCTSFDTRDVASQSST